MTMASFVIERRSLAAGLVLTLIAMCAGAQERTEVRVLLPRYAPDADMVLEAAAAAFEVEHPTVDVVIEWVEWSELFQALTIDLSAGTPPDISVVSFQWLADLVADGSIDPIDDRASEAFRSQFVAPLFTANEIGGKIWGLPFIASARAMYVNHSLLHGAGIDGAPPDWSALEAVASAVSAADNGHYGFGLQGAEIETDVYFYFALWSQGGEIINSDGHSGLGDPAAIAAAEMYRRLIDMELTQPGVTADNRQDVEDLFVGGRAAVIFSGPWLAERLTREAPTMDWDVAPIPVGETSVTYAVTDTLVLFAGSDAQDAAWQFVDFAFRSEWRSAFVRASGLLPTTRAVAEDPAFADDPDRGVFIRSLPEARMTPAVSNWEEMADITAIALRTVYDGDAPADVALPAAAAEIDAILSR